MTKAEKTRQLTRYRVLQGMHIQNDPDGVERTYRAGQPNQDTFETDANVLALNGAGGMQPKFQLLGGGTVETAPGVTWNPAEESIEAFAARMKKEAEPTKVPSPPALTPVKK